jgi:hypothetical protein
MGDVSSAVAAPAHTRLVQREGVFVPVDCDGQLVEYDRDDRHVHLECDACRYTVSVDNADPELARARLLRVADLPARFVDAPFPPHPDTEDARRHVRLLVDQWGADDCPRPPFLVGPYGRGKTHLLTRAARMLIDRHHVRVRYLTLADLLDEAKAAMDAPGRDTVQQVFDRAATVPLLVLDDLKELRTAWQVDVLEQLVDRRYRGHGEGPLPVMGATNVDRDGWGDAFGPRVASRLLELTHPVRIGGPHWRER